MRRLAACLLIVGCGATSREPCTQADADRIDAWYQRTIAERCAAVGRDTDDCPAMVEIDAEYDRRYDEWARCRK